MKITLVQALLIAFIYWISYSGIFTFGAFMLNWPVCNGFFIGLIMGDPIKGTMLGGLLQTLNMAPSMVGNTITMDLKMASFITIPMALATGLDAEAIITFAVPFTVIGAFIQPLTRTLNEVGVRLADKAAETGNTKLYHFANICVERIIQFPFYFILLFVCLYFGQGAMTALLNAIPEWLMLSFMTLAKFLPAIGFAMFLKSVNRKELLPMFFMGFYVMYFLKGAGLTMIGVTIFGVLIALLILLLGKNSELNSGGAE